MRLINVATLIAADHPTRAIKRMWNEALAAMSSHFDEIYAAVGAPQQKPLPRSRADSRAEPVCRGNLESRADDKIVRQPATKGAGVTPAGHAVCPHTAKRPEYDAAAQVAVPKIVSETCFNTENYENASLL